MESIKVYPTVDDLTTVVSSFKCTELGCNDIFKTESNLNLHLAKTHKKEQQQTLLISKKVNKEYYCPDLNCVQKQRFFKLFKQLKQHYIKVHSNKNIICDKCLKGFSSESFKNSHLEYCGITFTCCDCNASYNCYDTLQTHARRKKHKILRKCTFKKEVELKLIYFVDNTIPKKEYLMLPRPASMINLSHKGSQTDLLHEKVKHKNKRMLKRNNSQETQTFKDLQKVQTCAETQTIGDYIAKKSTCDLSSSSSSESLSKKSIKTQTTSISSMTKSSNTSFNVSDYQLGGGDVEKASFGTQTLYTNTPNPQNDSIHTDLVYELMNSSCQTSFTDNIESFDSTNFYNCNSETQTDVIIDLEMFSNDYYANMCTQTCEDIFSNELAFNNTHTQTVMDDILKSVESQTMMTLNSSSLMTRDMANIETQTEGLYKQWLEELNA